MNDAASALVSLAPGADVLPFAVMMAELVRQNLHDHPHKRRYLRKARGRVALVAEDADVCCTLRFKDDRLVVHPGLFGIPNVVIRGPSSALIDLSRVPPHPRLGALPDLRSEVARALISALRRRELRVYGLLAHLPLGLRLARLLSIY